MHKSPSVTWILFPSTQGSLGSTQVKNLPAMRETRDPSLGREDPLEKGMATHSSILAWRSPWTEEPGGLQTTRPQRVRHDWATNTLLSPRQESQCVLPYSRGDCRTAEQSGPRIHPFPAWKVGEGEGRKAELFDVGLTSFSELWHRISKPSTVGGMALAPYMDFFKKKKKTVSSCLHQPRARPHQCGHTARREQGGPSCFSQASFPSSRAWGYVDWQGLSRACVWWP